MNQPSPNSHPRDPLHGVTLETIVTQLVARHGWAEVGRRISGPLLSPRPQREVQPHVFAENALGTPEGRRVVHRRAKMNRESFLSGPLR